MMERMWNGNHTNYELQNPFFQEFVEKARAYRKSND
jgi:hypothetical protein